MDDPDRTIYATVQDALDGAALRRLRVALPEAGEWDVKGDALSPLVSVQVDWPVPADLPDGAYWWTEHGQRMDSVFGEGATIAEAADACREALG
jgi:hypothetical protein